MKFKFTIKHHTQSPDMSYLIWLSHTLQIKYPVGEIALVPYHDHGEDNFETGHRTASVIHLEYSSEAEWADLPKVITAANGSVFGEPVGVNTHTSINTTFHGAQDVYESAVSAIEFGAKSMRQLIAEQARIALEGMERAELVVEGDIHALGYAGAVLELLARPITSDRLVPKKDYEEMYLRQMNEQR